MSSSDEFIFNVLDWKARTKEPKGRSYPPSAIYTLFHDCDFGIDNSNTTWGFNYISKGTTICPFCRNKIPDEIIFLLEMIRK